MLLSFENITLLEGSANTLLIKVLYSNMVVEIGPIEESLHRSFKFLQTWYTECLLGFDVSPKGTFMIMSLRFRENSVF